MGVFVSVFVFVLQVSSLKTILFSPDPQNSWLAGSRALQRGPPGGSAEWGDDGGTEGGCD